MVCVWCVGGVSLARGGGYTEQDGGGGVVWGVGGWGGLGQKVGVNFFFLLGDPGRQIQTPGEKTNSKFVVFENKHQKQNKNVFFLHAVKHVHRAINGV